MLVQPQGLREASNPLEMSCFWPDFPEEASLVIGKAARYERNASSFFFIALNRKRLTAENARRVIDGSNDAGILLGCTQD